MRAGERERERLESREIHVAGIPLSINLSIQHLSIKNTHTDKIQRRMYRYPRWYPAPTARSTLTGAVM